MQIAKILSQCCGVAGMINGQAVDIQNKKLNLDDLNKMYIQKTANLIMAAAQIGCIVAGAPDTKIEAAKNYAKCLGLGFQIRDDLLDFKTEQTSTDNFSEKVTYISILGLKKAEEAVKDLTAKAIEKLKVFGDNADWLKKFALNLEKRHK